MSWRTYSRSGNTAKAVEYLQRAGQQALAALGARANVNRRG